MCGNFPSGRGRAGTPAARTWPRSPLARFWQAVFAIRAAKQPQEDAVDSIADNTKAAAPTTRFGSWICLLIVGLCSALPASAGARDTKAISDADINAAVEAELFEDNAVPHDRIDVSTNQGVVTLTGYVTNLLARDHAERLVQTIRGVRSVVNRIEITLLGKRSDEALQKDVALALAADPAADSYEIAVTAKGGLVTLNGKVSSFAERALSERLAKGVAGVKEVRNKLIVQYAKPRTDAEIKADVDARLRWDTYVRHDLITANVQNGAVTLTGSVGSAAERTRAFMDAWVMGTSSVDTSQLRVEPWPRSPAKRAGKPWDVTDEQIERALRTAFLYDPRVASYEVRADAKEGAVTLHGIVDNLRAKRAALHDARATTGVTHVIDRIRVRALSTKDDDIAKNIRAAFERDPYVERYELLVSVHDGTAYLRGTVDSFFEKMRADQLAASVKGVSAVRNNLTVYDDRSPLVYEPRVYDYWPYDYPWYRVRPFQHADAEIKDEIEDEMFWSPFVDANQVRVKVDAGVATLEGKVDDYAEMLAAVENAFEGGATRVNNRLRLGPN
jgi:osmotically-inducible protein OsmY